MSRDEERERVRLVQEPQAPEAPAPAPEPAPAPAQTDTVTLELFCRGQANTVPPETLSLFYSQEVDAHSRDTAANYRERLEALRHTPMV